MEKSESAPKIRQIESHTINVSIYLDGMLDPMKMLPDERPPENLLDDIIPSAMDASDTNMMQLQQQLQVRS